MSAAVYLSDPADGDSVPPGDPFQDDCGTAFYFDEAVRAKRLNLLFHLVPYSDVLLVTGETGSGKSCVLRRLLDGVPDSWRVCHLQATATLDDEQLRELLRKEFSLRPDDGQGDGDQYLRLLRESLYALRHSALIPVLAVDDAHLLAQPALALLAALTEPWQGRDKLLSVVLFAEASISKKLIAPGLETLRGRISHTFDLPPLSEEDTGRYIHHRLSVAAVDEEGTPFTSSVIKFIHVASRGLPGRINEFARVVLQNSAQRADGIAPSPSIGRGRVYIKYGVAALLILSLAIGLVIYHDRLFGLVASLLPGTAPPPVATTPAAVQSPSPPEEDMSQSAATGGPAVAEAPVTAMPEAVPIPDQATTSGEVSRLASEAPPPPAPFTAAVPAPPAAPGNAAAMAAMGPANAAPPPVLVDAAPPIPAASQPDAPAGTDVPSAADSVAVTPAPESKSDSAESPRDDAWLLAQDPAYYTLQLLVASRAQCLAYIERYGLGDAAAIFQTRSGGQPYFALIYGVYATEVDAADAGKALSDQDVKISPWVRRMGVIQARIQEFQATAGPAAVAATEKEANNKVAKAVTVANINKGVTAPDDLRHEAWLLEQPPEAYTLQLFTGQQANVLAYLKRHALADKVAVFHPADSPERLTVVYGTYPNAAQALQAAKELAAQLPDVKPWARSLREIQAVIASPAPADSPPP